MRSTNSKALEEMRLRERLDSVLCGCATALAFLSSSLMAIYALEQLTVLLIRPKMNQGLITGVFWNNDYIIVSSATAGTPQRTLLAHLELQVVCE